ncbi:MAG: L-aspartate oxidase [Gemmatimonadetes bacterium]|nr:L-aspartate oxidase [Gemmatimonadota bacterium]
MAAHRSDFLVLGSGIAGLVFAIRAAKAGTVSIVTKKRSLESNTNYAQGGIAAVLDPKDSFELHIKDTLVCGEGLSDERSVRKIVEEGPELVRELAEWGVRFSQTDGAFDLGREGGHSKRRIAHAKDTTGREVERALLAEIKRHPRIKMYEYHHAFELVRNDHGEIWGAHTLDLSNGRLATFLARKTLLGTGGAGKVYVYTTNPDIASGDGFAMAYRAGARLSNLEFVQFHPTCLYHPKAKSFLISEAVRGEGAILRTLDGKPFMQRYHELKDLAPRDTVARAIDHEMKTRGDRHVYLDLSNMTADRIMSRFPNIHKTCFSLGIDITKEPIPVVPAAHYMCGGVNTDYKGRTSVPRLYACGEVSHTGVHGANRLASNSLLEALVYSVSAAEEATRSLDTNAFPRAYTKPPKRRVVKRSRVSITHNWDAIRNLMWDYVGIVRNTVYLRKAAQKLAPIRAEVEELYERHALMGDLVELRNIALVGELIIKCASRRKESRGLHYMEDFPRRLKGKAKNTLVFRRVTKVGAKSPPKRKGARRA